MTIHKTFVTEVVQKTDAGGRITISTAGMDRDRDRVLPRGAVLDNYMKNPVVMWGHSYEKPSDIIGRTVGLEITDAGIVADFELRPAANDQDPQNVVRLLWDGGWIRTASIGFRPLVAEPNEFGGNDFKEWELLEYSLTPIPANADALRLAAKALGMAGDAEQSGIGIMDTLVELITPAVVEAIKADEAAQVADPPVPADGKQDDTGSNSEGAAPHSAPDAEAIQAAQELRLAAILADFMQALRPYLAV